MRTKQCLVAFALPARQFLWAVELPLAATVEELLQQARIVARARGEDRDVDPDRNLHRLELPALG